MLSSPFGYSQYWLCPRSILRGMAFFGLIFCFAPTVIWGQTVAVRPNFSCMTKTNEVWDITIENKTSQNVVVTIEVVVTDDKQVVQYKAKTTNVSAIIGWTKLNNTALQTQVEIQSNISDFSNKNTYNIRYNIYSIADNALLGSFETNSKNCIQQNITTDTTTLAIKKKPAFFHFSGRGYASTAYTEMPSPEHLSLNGWAHRSELTETITLGVAPIDVTERYFQDALYPTGTWQIAYSFNLAQFQENLKLAAMRKIEQELAKRNIDTTKMKNIAQALKKENYPELDKWKTQLAKAQNINKDSLYEVLAGSERQAAYLEEAIGNSSAKTLMARHNIKNVGALDSMRNKLSSYEYAEIVGYYKQKADLKALKAELKNTKQMREGMHDIAELEDKIKKIEALDLKDMANNPESIGLLVANFLPKNKWTRALMNIKSLHIGTFYPYQSPFTINGIALNGGELKYTILPKLTLGTALGSVQVQPRDTLFTAQQTALQPLYLYNAALTYGDIQGTNVKVTYTNIQSVGLEKPIVNTMGGAFNGILSMGGAVSFFKKKAVLSGEYDMATYTAATNNPATLRSEAQTLFIPLPYTSTTLSDAALNLNALFKATKTTQFTGFYNKVGDKYYALSAPYLVRNMERYELRLTQDFWKNKVSVSGFYGQDFNQLSPSMALFRVLHRTYGLSTQISLPKLPKITATLSNYEIRADKKEVFQTAGQQGSSFQVLLSQNIKLDKKAAWRMNLLGDATVLLQKAVAQGQTNTTIVGATLGVNHAKLGFNVRTAYQTTRYNETTQNLMMSDIMLQTMPFKSGTLRGGWQYYHTDMNTNRQLFYGEYSQVIFRNINLSLRANYGGIATLNRAAANDPSVSPITQGTPFWSGGAMLQFGF
jgi:hypothetical protein